LAHHIQLLSAVAGLVIPQTDKLKNKAAAMAETANLVHL
jgi:hypothetical protein